jgi:alpha-beta hydrolase superfamily lysophospholipase
MLRFLALLLLLPLAAPGAKAQEQMAVATRPGITEAVTLTRAPNATATVVLFPGGSGQVAAVRNNFLLRITPRLVEAGLNVAVVDVPSDQAGGMSWNWRATADHAADIAAIVATLKARAPVPLFLVGTSNGSISAGVGAVSVGPPAVAGLVLTSAVWARGMQFVAAERIRVPVLIVHNKDDGCAVSPYTGAEPFKARLASAPSTTLIVVSGGTSRSAPCEAMSPHGYLGLEDQVVPRIVDWIRAH